MEVFLLSRLAPFQLMEEVQKQKLVQRESGRDRGGVVSNGEEGWESVYMLLYF